MDQAAAELESEQQKSSCPCSRWRGPRRAAAQVAWRQAQEVVREHCGDTEDKEVVVGEAAAGAGVVEQTLRDLP